MVAITVLHINILKATLFMVLNNKEKQKKKPIGALSFFTALFLVLSAGQVFSHPHVFVDAGIEIELDDKGIKGIWQYWTFDEYYSAWLVNEYDRDPAGDFTEDALKLIYEQTFMNLKHHGYFTKIIQGKEKSAATHVEHFSVKIQNNHAVYSFFVPLGINIGSSGQDIYVAVYDESFFCQVVFPAGQVGFKGNLSEWKFDYSTQEMPELTYYFGFMVPTAVRVTLTPS